MTRGRVLLLVVLLAGCASVSPSPSASVSPSPEPRTSLAEPSGSTAPLDLAAVPIWRLGWTDGVAMQKDGLRPTCAVLCYGYMLDLDGLTGVAEAAAAWRFVNASAGKSVDDLRRDVPLFVARAGRDQFAGLNEGVDRFLANAVARNLPVTFVNHPEGPHAFDLDHDSETTREIIRGILAFMRCRLGAAPVEGGR